MVRPLILRAVACEWYCPNCPARHRTFEQNPHLPFHACPALAGITAPFLRVGVKAKVEAREREDYVGADSGNVTLDGNGRPIMSVVTTRDDGQDCTVFAPCAIGSIHA